MGGFFEQLGEAQIAQAQAEAQASAVMGEALATCASAAATAVASGAASAYHAISDFFGPKLIGAPIERCSSNKDQDRATQLKEKKERLAKRNALIQNARMAAPSLPDDQRQEVLAAADRLEKDNKVIERARLSQDVYDANPIDSARRPSEPPLGWTRLSDDDKWLSAHELSKSNFAPPNSEFRAALYQSEDGTLVVAFKGSISTFNVWKNNAQQALGFESDYYDRALRLAKKLNHDGLKYETTGHSLGGGVASLVSAVSDAPGTTFNSVGLNAITAHRAGVNIGMGDELVDAYHVLGEVLTGVQVNRDALIFGVGAALGGWRMGAAAAAVADMAGIAPTALGTPHILPAVDQLGRSRLINNPFALHGMDYVINGIEKEKADDQQTLRSISNQSRIP